MTGDVVFLDGGCDEFFGDAVAIDVGSVPGVQATVVGALEQGVDFRWVRDEPGLPVGVAWSESETRLGASCTKTGSDDLPNDMAPRMGTETRKPDLPNWVYETLVSSRLFWRDWGTGGRASPIVRDWKLV